MISEEDIQALLQRAPTDAASESAFFRALLDASIYTLAPLSDDHPRLRLISFKRPDGVEFIPLFADEAKAAASAEGQLRVVRFCGRAFFEATLGATVVINPNDEHCILYPEEIPGLLATGYVARLEVETAPAGVYVEPNPEAPAWLIERLRKLYAELPYVDAVRLIGAARSNAPERQVLTIVIVTAKSFGERAAHATITALQLECKTHDCPVDVTTVPTDNPDNSLSGIGLLIYERVPPQ
jgi:hypothetical protein